MLRRSRPHEPAMSGTRREDRGCAGLRLRLRNEPDRWFADDAGALHHFLEAGRRTSIRIILVSSFPLGFALDATRIQRSIGRASGASVVHRCFDARGLGLRATNSIMAGSRPARNRWMCLRISDTSRSCPDTMTRPPGTLSRKDGAITT